MKIAVHTTDGGKKIANPFVRSGGFLVYDVDNWQIKNCHYCPEKTLDQLIEAKDVAEWDAIISRGLPKEIKNQLEQMGKEVMITFTDSPQNAIRAFLSNKMQEALIH
ncbi:NifB/NifX family molybdenum-iron cluster-binding protein [Ignavibacterium album]|uniref:NifB/NifX family molybdenum-iron cluster-binding protein n=1 Tax=Ignavibacterium album TaxID=591197 RepID=UPI0038B29080